MAKQQGCFAAQQSCAAKIFFDFRHHIIIIQNMWEKFYQEWLPTADDEMIPDYDIENDLPGDPSAPDYVSEICIPVCKKSSKLERIFTLWTKNGLKRIKKYRVFYLKKKLILRA
jgi:AraC family transcriptional regulator